MISDNPFLSLDKEILGEVYSSTESLDNLTILCDEFGSRFPGTEGDRASVEFMVDKLKCYGLKNAHYETFNLLGWVRGRGRLEIVDPIQKSLECISLPHALPGRVESKLIDLGDGPLEAYEKRKSEIDGNIVMVTSRTPFDMKRSLHRTEKYLRSILAGAKGFIFMSHYPAYGPITGVMYPITPAVGISYENGQFLSRLIKRYDEIDVKLETSDEIVEQTSYNVVADIPGSSDEEEFVIVGAHYEGHDISQGAIDSGSGACVVLEIARVLNKINKSINRRIRFICFGVEEIGCYGSVNYVKHHDDELSKIMFMLNLDAAGNEGRKGVGFNGVPELEPFFRKAVEEMKVDAPIYQTVTPYSDHFPFFVKGIPTASGGDPEARIRTGGRGYGHTHYDTVDKVELHYLREAAANYARFLLRVANNDKWPAKHRKRCEVESILKEQGFFETVQLNQQVKEYVSKWGQISPYTKAWIDGRIAQATDFW
jgi:Iap family predicted aminopeptidase